MKQLKSLLLMAGTALVLSACGGGGSSDQPDQQANALPAPEMADMSSASSWIGYLMKLGKAEGAEKADPFAVSGAGITALPEDPAGDPIPVR